MMMSRTAITRRALLGTAAAAAASAAATTPAAATPGRPSAGPAAGRGPHRPFDEARVRRWAADTWTSMLAMTDEETGLPADNIAADLAAEGRSGYTSPTNIGGLLWSAVVARELGLLSNRDTKNLCRRTLSTLLEVERHEHSGMFFNWYDEATGAALRAWPGSGDVIHPFCSSVDNAWLGTALRVVGEAVPSAGRLADQLFRSMRWDAFYNPGTDPAHPSVRPGGLMHGGFFPFEHDRPDGVYQGTHVGGDPVWLTTHHYDTIVSETRMTSYLGILTGQVPAQHYYAAWRTFPASCDWSWQESQPVGETRTYLGIEVYEGAYSYRGMRVVPGWGGSMFEELMPDVFVPESRWGPRSWGRNHPLHVRAQREHGLEQAGYGYWGFSPSSDPFGGYREYGVDQLGLSAEGYCSDRESTNVDVGFGDCREATNPDPTFGDGVVTPHASFLAMAYEPEHSFRNLAGIEDELEAYGPGGFHDAVAVSGTRAERHLSLDQAMIMGAVGNVLERDVLRRAFGTRRASSALRPLLGREVFGAGIG
ncbi:glucoamylase family protein [Pseudactinotalea suaedae]|uniref:glucoamylase family protein n=1 Tax=Pseudactinotalea suaedae TaxID=1524924 RepID=UPI001F501524|nr:glucoamylase family protein [Pseudactinotalea suaedae]